MMPFLTGLMYLLAFHMGLFLLPFCSQFILMIQMTVVVGNNVKFADDTKLYGEVALIASKGLDITV